MASLRKASLFAVLFAATQSNAALLVSNSGTGGIIFNATVGNANTLGWKFNVGSEPLTVSSLGFYDANSDGLISAVSVGLWHTASNTQIATANVVAGTGPSLVNDYRFVDLAQPVLLLPNQSYTIGYRSTAGGSLQDGRNRVGQIIAAEVTIPAGGFGLRHSFENEPLSTNFATQMPAMNLGDTVPLTGPNMIFTIGPEPTTLAAAVLPMVILRRRR